MGGNDTLRRWAAQNSAVNFSWLLAFVSFLPAAIFACWLAVGVEGKSLLWSADLGLLFGAAGGSIMCFIAAVRYAGTGAGRAWTAVGLGMLLMALGEGAWGFQELILGREVPYPSLADVGYLAFYPPVFLGLLMMPQAPVSGLRRLKLVAELVIATAAISLVSYHLVISNLLSESMALGDWVTVAYPVSDLLLVGAAIALLVRGGRNLTNMNLGLLALGFAAIGITDSLYTYLSSVNDYNSGNYIDLGWMVAYGLITLAAAGAAGRELNVDAFRIDDERAHPVWHSLALNLTLLPVAVILFFSDSTVVTSGFVVLVGMSLGSHLLTHLEIARLNGELRQMAETLQARVQSERVRSLIRTAPASEVASDSPSDTVADVLGSRFGR